jgi:hypothetical protein
MKNKLNDEHRDFIRNHIMNHMKRIEGTCGEFHCESFLGGKLLWTSAFQPDWIMYDEETCEFSLTYPEKFTERLPDDILLSWAQDEVVGLEKDHPRFIPQLEKEMLEFYQQTDDGDADHLVRTADQN